MEIYLPKVREIVINLLQGLKRKQARYRARTHGSEGPSKPSSIRQQSLEVSDVPSKDPTIKDSPGTEERRRQSPARRPVGAREEPKREAPQNRDGDRPEIVTQPASPVLPTEQTARPPPTNEALQKLQTSDALQRRASKRYSAYNFAKLDGLDADTITRNPPPIPARRSGSYSPELTRIPTQPDQKMNNSSTRRRSPERRPQPPAIEPPVLEEDESMFRARERVVDLDSRPSSVVRVTETDTAGLQQPENASPQKIPVFLQLGSAVRKTLVSLTDLTLQSLRLLFVEKFQFNPGAETFPDILVTDRETGVRYILEEGVQDIVEGTTLTLDVEGNPP